MDDIIINMSDIQNSLSTDVNKSLLVRMSKVFMDLEKVLQREEEPSIFKTVLKWCRLFLDTQTAINPKHTKLMQQYENAASTALTYIVGYLQYQAKEITNYHYTLLEILDTLLQNLPRNVLRRCDNFETGTIACLCKPMEFAVDYKTQFLALKVFSMFLKNLDEDKWHGELETIENNSLYFFKEDLSAVLKEATSSCIFENASRELLNNYNVHVLNNVNIFSFNCNFVTIGRKCEVFKHLNSEKFWIDLNYCTQSISFKGRFRRDSSSKYQNVDVTLRVEDIKIETGILLIHFSKSNIDIFPIPSMENIAQIFLPHQEEQRLKRNRGLIEFVDNLKGEKGVTGSLDVTNESNSTEDVFDRLKNEALVHSQGINNNTKNETQTSYTYVIETAPTEDIHKTVNNSAKSTDNAVTNVTDISPVSTKRNNIGHLTKHPIQKLRPKRRKFTNSYEEDYVPHKRTKKEKKKHVKTKYSARKRSKPQSNQAPKMNGVGGMSMQPETDLHNTNTIFGANMIVDATKEITLGNECVIGSNENSVKRTLCRRTNNKAEPSQSLNKCKANRKSHCQNHDGSSTNAYYELGKEKSKEHLNEISNSEILKNGFIQEQEPLLNSINVNDECVPIKSILKRSRSIMKTTTTIDVEANDDFNFSKSPTNDDLSDDFPQLRSPENRTNSIMIISTPRSMAQTPTSTGMMNVSDSSCIIDDQTQSESDGLNREIEEFNKLQEIINDWPDSDDSDLEGFGNVQEQANRLETSYRQEHKHTSDNLRPPIFDVNKSPTISEDSPVLICNNVRIEKCLNLLRHCLNNATDINKQQVCEMAESIVRESKQQRNELQELIIDMDNLRAQIELQRLICMKRSVQIERFQTETEQLLSDLAKHSEINTGITNKSEQLINQFSEIEF